MRIVVRDKKDCLVIDSRCDQSMIEINKEAKELRFKTFATPYEVYQICSGDKITITV